jgi:hypothetical protein
MYVYHGYYSAIKKNEIVSLGRKWMELEMTMMSKISQIQMSNIASSCSFVEPRPKRMMIIVMEY